MDRDRATAIVERWLALSPAPSVRVALVAASPKLDQLAREAAEWLAALTAGATPEFPGRRAVFVAGDSSDPASSPVAEARRSDVVVLLVQSGSRMKDLIDAAGTLGRAGHRPDWSLLVDSVKKTRRTLELARAGDARPARS
jgi:hypothetical protein